MPRVYDKAGHELTVGARVEVVGFAHKKKGERGPVVRVDDALGRACARVDLGLIHPARFFAFGVKNVCPDLLFIDSPSSTKQTTEEAAQAAPEGAER
jgi:hypothetical protein